MDFAVTLLKRNIYITLTTVLQKLGHYQKVILWYNYTTSILLNATLLSIKFSSTTFNFIRIYSIGRIQVNLKRSFPSFHPQNINPQNIYIAIWHMLTYFALFAATYV